MANAKNTKKSVKNTTIDVKYNKITPSKTIFFKKSSMNAQIFVLQMGLKYFFEYANDKTE